jgi:hypothetical protein
MELHNVPIHKEPVHFDSEPTSASYTVTSTPTPQQGVPRNFFGGWGAGGGVQIFS